MGNEWPDDPTPAQLWGGFPVRHKSAYADGIKRAAAEMNAWAESSAALKGNHGNTDDAKAFAKWLLALAGDIEAGLET